MIKDIGIDITSVRRIEKALNVRRDRFLKRVFTPREIEYCLSKPRPAIHLAGRFAAKEAVKKAGKTSLNWTEIEIISDKNRKPAVKLLNAAERATIHLSISHTNDYAVAFVTIEGES